MTRALALGLSLGVMSACIKAAAPPSPPQQSPTTNIPSGPPSPGSSSTATSAPVVVVVMENHEYSSIIGSASAPFINGTLIARGRLFTNYHAVSHPSLPNYLAMTSGGTGGKAGTASVSAGELHDDNLFHQLSEAGVGWRAFEESVPTACYQLSSYGSSPDTYALKHDPAMAYADVAKTPACHNVVPLSELRASGLPPFSFVTPNECDDMHSCPIAAGDAWLRDHIPALLRAGATVMVTFDEGSTDAGGGGHVLTVEDGPGIVKSTDAAPFTHYSLLAGLEDHWHLGRLQLAKTATPLPV